MTPTGPTPAVHREPSTHGGWELNHRYGERVHILDNAHLLTLLARLGSPDVKHPDLVPLLRTIYEVLLVSVAGNEFPRVHGEVPTRMTQSDPKSGVYRGPILDPATRIVIVDVIRAGIVPSQTCFEMLTRVLPEEHMRLDHLNMSRVADARGHVSGVDLSGSKIGGTVDGAILLLPDPMGATGSTTIRAVRHYLDHFGQPARIVTMPMIATPEYLRAVLTAFGDDLVVYTARLDRGLSPQDVLADVPGAQWERERGLNDHDYIVPGAGGMGEVLNNSWC
ncbi:MAG: uracil phosphoribosyltransferase [Planctomycetes bacterium]|nr:uracil phosphoribosyltransferase [Planctomycetota bacterium]MBI3845435.1 uracil phosphoribosyltransferase [Planctomycetota bacterium]